jgi:hypothetical protein
MNQNASRARQSGSLEARLYATRTPNGYKSIYECLGQALQFTSELVFGFGIRFMNVLSCGTLWVALSLEDRLIK